MLIAKTTEKHGTKTKSVESNDRNSRVSVPELLRASLFQRRRDCNTGTEALRRHRHFQLWSGQLENHTNFVALYIIHNQTHLSSPINSSDKKTAQDISIWCVPMIVIGLYGGCRRHIVHRYTIDCKAEKEKKEPSANREDWISNGKWKLRLKNPIHLKAFLKQLFYAFLLQLLLDIWLTLDSVRRTLLKCPVWVDLWALWHGAGEQWWVASGHIQNYFPCISCCSPFSFALLDTVE